MLKKIKILLKFYNIFPFLSAIKLSFNFLIGNFQKVQLPNYKTPFYLRKNTSDFRTFVQVFLDNQYNLNFDRNAKIIIDGGANIGLFAIKLKNELPNVKIICIEPDLENFTLTQKNLASYSNIFFENSGLWNTDTNLKIHDKYNCGKWGMVVEEDRINGTVQAVSIDSLLIKYGIDYIDVLKLDIETSEKQLFSKNFLNWLPKVKLIIIEFHDGFEKGCSKTFFEAINKTFNDYSLSVRGENIVIRNNDLN